MPDMTEHTDPLCLSEATAAALLVDAPWRRFGVIGDSLSAGIGDPTPGYANKGWADRVADALRLVAPDAQYRNLAEIGATTSETITGQLDRMAEFAPDLLHLPCGPNDIMRRDPDFDEIEQTLRRMYDAASRTGAQLITFTLGRAFVMPSVADWNQRSRAMNDITRRVAGDYGALVIDMWNHPVNDRDNLLSADRIHFSTSGQAVMAAEVIRGLAGVPAIR
ncbi:SGNH/GDSL hydrolase family protein [Nocardia cyriacigeorgica]|uniref:SGNH/GDSL hydrolase family protein n=1 Tax=Nocardia cyriacigeorgica TaxID=135487 RepID=UPI001892FA33|nr:SGNH/GDSL hydrolase family protein [Nocardia cyriacigeorgica]MBF6456429.1 SGNH/GDSL hydrolase family protein [Nocardia cyriacigeorgica]MBF6479395.1 SGNH/GDSL hydrolase family protein [Nocardia cyriacigeorgica]MBF6551235.1 SGNH/GDSL hydrolase family protein [Nocardia cyriacigeorgica]